MAGIGRTVPIAWAVLLYLFLVTAGRAATIFSDPGRPEDLIFDARFAAAVAVTRSAVAPAEVAPDRPKGLLRAGLIARCVVAATSAGRTVGVGAGYIWSVGLCLEGPEPPKRKRIAGFSYGLSSLGGLGPVSVGLVPPTSPTNRSASRAPLAPVPLPAGLLGFGAALGMLAALKRRR